MAVDKIKWNLKGFKQLRKERGVMSDLIARGTKIATAAGAGYVANPFTGKTRGRVSVFTETPEAQLDNARNNSLIRALDAGR